MNKNINILLLEDDPNLGIVLEDYFDQQGYAVTRATNGEDGLRLFFDKATDLCIVDIMMPKMDGFSFVKHAKKSNPSVPVIFLTAKSMNEDKIEGFKLGADDYITKPFLMEELGLRVEAVLRRTALTKHEPEESDEFQIGSYKFLYRLHQLHKDGKIVTLTGKEAELLRLLCLHLNKTLEREVALKVVWENDSYFTGRSMDVFVSKLRKYLSEDPSVEIITQHGKGLRLVVKS